MDRQDIESFVRRDWSRAADTKRQYWAERFERDGSQSTWQAAQALLAHVRSVRPDYPTISDRASDLDDHLSLLTKFDRAADALARRSSAPSCATSRMFGSV